MNPAPTKWNSEEPSPFCILQCALYRQHIPAELRRIVISYLRTVFTTKTLQAAVYQWKTNSYRCTIQHGHISEWDTSGVTIMSNLFANGVYGPQHTFNEDISLWNVSNVIDMSCMFNRVTDFNQPLNDWDVRNVRSMRAMFCSSGFNQPLNDWNVSNVTDMGAMFDSTLHFNQPLDQWDVRNVTIMSRMFAASYCFNQPLHNWQVTKGTNLNRMLTEEHYNQPLPEWAVNVSDIFYTFEIPPSW